jgi:hypothetical protein
MDKVLFVGWVLRRLDDGEFFRKLFAAILAGLAVAGGIYALVAFLIGWKEIFALSGEAMAGGILYQATFVVASYAAIHTLLLRARALNDTVLVGNPILTVAAAYCRVSGEVWAFMVIPLGLGGGVLNWFAGQRAQAIYKPAAGMVRFLNGVPASFSAGGLLIVKGLAYGLAGFLLAYVVAELLTLAANRPPHS